MPLLHKKAFAKKKPSSNIKPTDKVFFCELTEEVFTDYDEFWERLVLLNALVWTCELTGRPNLTYQEALDCERKARRCISNVSPALKKPLLYVASLTKRGRIVDASDDIFSYVRDRYFVGEEVEAIVSNHWYDCKVTKIIMPTKEEITEYEKSLEDSDGEVKCLGSNLVNGKHAADDDDDDIIIVRDDHLTSPVKEKNVQVIKDEEEDYPPFPSVKYEVIEIEAWDYKEAKRHIVGWDQIRRSKSAFTREKCKLFVKEYMVLGHEGYWKVKDSIKKTFKLSDMKYPAIFVGNPPKFEETLVKRNSFPAKIGTGFKKEKEKDKDKEKGKEKDKKVNKTIKQREDKEKREEPKKEINLKNKKKTLKPLMTEEAKEAAKKFQLELKEKSKEQFRKRLELKKLETKWKKDVEKEENRLMKIYEIEWWQKREDLECEDHKDLPIPSSFTCRIPQEYFGDFLMTLDFVNTFAEILELGDVYPDGISYEMLEQALVAKEVAGVFNDVLQLLLGAIFSLQEEEDEEVDGDTTMDMASMNFEENLESKCQMAAVNIANKASTWSQQYQGVSLQKAPLDALTLTEVLRIHILASGATNVANAMWRHIHRGGFKHTDDPGLQFKLDEPEIIKKLTTESLFDLTIEEKIKIMNVLVAQILTYASVRDNVEEKLEKLKELSNNYRTYKWAAVRKEREEISARKQKIKDIKVKMEKKLLTQRLQSSSDLQQDDANKAKIIMKEELVEIEGGDKEKETRASMKKREESEKQEKDFIEQIDSLHRDMRQFQLGQDRAFRRYWVFNSIPGLFVEDINDHVGSCLDHPTPVSSVIYPKDNNELKEIIKSVAIRNVQIRNKEKENEKNTSDKENENSFITPSKSEAKTPLLENNLLKMPNSNNVLNKQNSASVNDKETVEEETYSPNSNEDDEEIVDFIDLPERPVDIPENLKEFHSRIFGLCSANSLTCPVHAIDHSRPKWAYYNKEEDLENLINNLNVRGLRECELKDNLIQQKEKIKRSIQKTATFTFSSAPKEENQTELKKCLKRNLNFPNDTPVDRIMELTLRDIILETEEKIDNGMLGALKLAERDVWRQAIVDGTSLSFNNPQDLDWGGKKRINHFKSSLGMETTEDDLGDMDEFVSKDGLTEAGVVKELAIAILQVAQALDHKYLTGPLAESSKILKKRRKLEDKLTNKFKNKKPEVEGNNEDSSEDEEESPENKISSILTKNIDNSLRTPFERWEKSLMACTSFSQLCLHLATLDNSITWSRSAVVNKRCRVCRRTSDSENVMLLCDGCDAGYHMYCLKPKLKSVPSGDWFCDKCKPKIKAKSPRKQRIVYREEEEEEGEEEEEENEENDEDEDEEEEEPEFVNLEYCYACEMGGELVLCDTCPKSLHLECADLKKIPKGNWSCPFCLESKENTNSKRKSNSGKSSNSKSSNKRLKTDEEIEEVLRRSSRSKFDDENENRRGKNSKKGSVEIEQRGKNGKKSSEEIEQRGRNSKRSSEEMEQGEIFNQQAIEKIIHQLMSHHDSAPFRKPVYKQEAPDYYEKIKKPIDLRTIKIRFNKNKYETDAEFIADVLLIFQNTQQYYEEGSLEYKAGLKLSKYFLKQVRNSNLHSAGLIENEYEPPSKKKRKS